MQKQKEAEKLQCLQSAYVRFSKRLAAVRKDQEELIKKYMEETAREKLKRDV